MRKSVSPTIPLLTFLTDLEVLEPLGPLPSTRSFSCFGRTQLGSGKRNILGIASLVAASTTQRTRCSCPHGNAVQSLHWSDARESPHAMSRRESPRKAHGRVLFPVPASYTPVGLPTGLTLSGNVWHPIRLLFFHLFGSSLFLPTQTHALCILSVSTAPPASLPPSSLLGFGP